MDLNYAHRKLIQENMKSIFYVNTYRPNLDVSKSYSSDWTSSDEENDRIMSSLKWNINDIFTLRSSLLYEKSDRKLIATQSIYTRPDGLYNAYNFKYPTQGQESENYSGNMYLDSKFEIFDVNHLLTVGYSENYQKYLMGSYAINSYLVGKTLDEIKNSSLPNAIAPNGLKVPDNKTQYKNVLIGDDIVFDDQWSALVGFNYATVIQTSYSSGVQSSKYDESALTPTLSLMYKPFEDLTTYVTYIESLEAGSVVGDSYSNSGEILDPLVSKQYEVGAKYSINESILLTSALFRIEKANQYSDLATPKPKYVQDGEQIHQGMELTATGKVTDNLTIFGGGT
ncbi:TonB-dependent receptor, partial [Aliarcobacter butzleri]